MIYAGRDAVLPKIVRLIQEGRIAELGVPLEGMVIFHTAVSDAGIGPTSSNKLEIESSIAPLSAAGVRMHLGKGALSAEISAPSRKTSRSTLSPLTALLTSKMLSRRVVAFLAEGIEAFHELLVEGFPAIIAAAHGRSIYDRET